METIISKIKGIECRVEQREVSKNETDIFCYGNSECDTCCGLEICECNNKLIKKEFEEKKKDLL